MAIEKPKKRKVRIKDYFTWFTSKRWFI